MTLPLNSSLISGSQTLFGFKTALQFGKLTATTVFSQQKGKKQEVTVQGGAQTQQFSLGADNYESNKHFFLSHYFRNKYDSWMATIPVVTSPNHDYQSRSLFIRDQVKCQNKHVT